MKTSFPQLEIGIQVSGRFLIDQFTTPTIPCEYPNKLILFIEIQSYVCINLSHKYIYYV